jgi:hypothetical protein
MRVATAWGDGTLGLKLRLDDHEKLAGIGQQGMSIRLVTNDTVIRHPSISERVHPDLVALAILSVVIPWVGRLLLLDVPVSQGFSDAVEAAFGLGVGPVDEGLVPRPRGERIGLLYSGGADSGALLGLLPSDSPLIFLKRIRHRRVPNRATHLRVDVSEYFARKVETPQRRLQVASTDLEFLCQPFPTFPTWPAVGIGAVLLADHLDLGAVASGLILGGRYMRHGLRFDPDSENDQAWRTVFDAVGLPLLRGTEGATEILTYELAHRAGLSEITRSCQLGTIEAPCWNCKVCLRRELIRAAHLNEPLPRQLLDNIATNEKVLAPLMGRPPYYQQHIFEYTLARVPGLEGTVLETAMNHLRPSRSGTEWLRRYYSPALDKIPDPWRDPFERKLMESADFMSEAERLIVESWDVANR